MANTKCDSSAPTGAMSKRSVRKAWFPQLSAATAQLISDVKVDDYKTSPYPEGCDIAGLKYRNKEKLKQWLRYWDRPDDYYPPRDPGDSDIDTMHVAPLELR